MATWHSMPPIWVDSLDWYSINFPHHPGSLVNDQGFYIDANHGGDRLSGYGCGCSLWGRSSGDSKMEYIRWWPGSSGNGNSS
jgi:hypothetical protein